MTGAFESARAGAIVPWAMQCSNEPLCVCVALYKGNRISPIVRDSRVFGLCLIDGKSKLLVKRFGEMPAGPAKPDADPFIAFEVTNLVSEAPILARCIGALDCQVIRHLDFDGDHEMYIGQVVASRLGEV
jgi:flavin reductase (DIM6/NTAB) family NADH-FMN oxidoreductase RutF